MVFSECLVLVERGSPSVLYTFQEAPWAPRGPARPFTHSLMEYEVPICRTVGTRPDKERNEQSSRAEA